MRSIRWQLRSPQAPNSKQHVSMGGPAWTVAREAANLRSLSAASAALVELAMKATASFRPNCPWPWPWPSAWPRLAHASLAVCLGLGVSSLSGCGKGSGQAPGLSARKALDVTPSPLAIPDAIERGEVFAHFSIGTPRALLATIDRDYNLPASGVSLDEKSLRSQLAGIAGERRAIADKIELDSPFGCVIVDPGPHMQGATWPAACVLGYEGGAAALIADLGKDGKAKDASGHAAAYDLFGKSLFIDELGDAVVLSGAPDLFAETKAYIEKNIVATAESSPGVRLTVFVSAIAQQYSALLAPMLQAAMAQPAPAATSDDPRLNALIAAVHANSVQSQRDSLTALMEIEQLSFELDPGKSGMRLSAEGRAKADAPRLKLMGQRSASPLDPTLLASLPKLPAFVIATHQSPSASLAAFERDGLLELVQGMYEALSQQKTDIRPDFQKLMKGAVDSLEGASSTAAYSAGEDLGAMVTVLRMKKGASLRSYFKQLMSSFPPAKFGPETAQYANWSFETDVMKVAGASIDRFSVIAGPKTRAELEQDPSAAELKAFLGDWKLELHATQVQDVAILVVAPKHESAFLERSIAAVTGKAGISGDPGFGELASRVAGNNSSVAIDVKSAIAWGSVFLDADDRKELLAHPLGQGLDDILIRWHATPEGHFAAETDIAQTLIEQIRAILQKQ